MDFTAYLNFDGTCDEAFRFYADTLHGDIEFRQTMGESPMRDQTPPEQRDRIMHVRLRAGDGVLMGSDAPPEMHPRPSGFAVSINLDDTGDAERIFSRLSDGGTVQMPLGETFWAKRFGMVTDRYGTPWMINSGMQDPSQS